MAGLQFEASTHTYTLDGKEIPSVTEICAPLTAGKYPPAGVVDAAAARGTRVHELCALYDMDALPEQFEGDLLPYLQAWASFCRDYRPQWEYIEHCMSGELDGDPLAGTADRIGVIDGRRVVVDIKTAQSLDRPAKVALGCQLAGYAILARCNGMDLFDPGLGVQLLKNGSYRVYEEKKLGEKYGFHSHHVFCALRLLHKITKGK